MTELLTLNTTLYPFILHHCLNNTALVPASFYLNRAFSLGAAIYSYPFRLTKLRYRKALLMNSQQSYELGIDIQKQDDKISCEFSLPAEEQSVASCSIEKLPQAERQKEDIQSCKARCSQHLTKDQFYKKIAENFLNFGPLHQGVESIQFGRDEAIGKVNHLSELKDDRFLFHPSFLDAFSHIGLILLDPISLGNILVTASQDAFELYQPIPDETWCQAKVISRQPNELCLDVFIYSLDGMLVAKIVNYRLLVVSQSQVFPQASDYCTLAWEAQPLEGIQQQMSKLFLLTNDPKVSMLLADAKVYTLEDQEACMQELAKDASHSSLIIYFSPQDEIYGGNISALTDLLGIIQKIVAAGIIQLHRLVILTKSDCLSQAALDGFCQVANQEFPLYNIQLIHFDEIDADCMLSLKNELSLEALEQRISYQKNKRQVLRLQPISQIKDAKIEPEGTYLITGGLGGIGHAITNWLLTKGVKQVVLLSRSEPTTPQKAYLEAHKSVLALRCDVTDLAAVKDVIQKVHNQPYPLKGIFHAAGINRDNVITSLTKEDCEVVCKPKILGTLNLREATAGITLDHFVLFSSVTAFLGTSGVANYAAANSFLDAYAAAKGIKSLNWGPWEQGLLSKLGKEVRAFWEEQGFKVLSDVEGTNMLSKAMGLPCNQVAIMPVNWPSLLSTYTTNAKNAILQKMMKIVGYEQKEPSAKASIVEELKSAPEDARRDILADFILSLTQELTKTDVTDTSLPFNQLGFTSITTVEMTKRLQNILLVQLPATLLYNYSSIDALSEFLLAEKLNLKEPPKDPIALQPQKQQSSAKETISNDDLNSLLNDIDKL